ncbi:hypothetical protein M2408_002519 [Sphingobacterium sp. BIGb0165]|nr:hypothetical protein [Sphingobacterium sp. BIGb0165]
MTQLVLHSHTPDISEAEISIAYISGKNSIIARVLILLEYMLSTFPSSCSVTINCLLGTTFGSNVSDLSLP